MSFYKKHVFFCVNEREAGRKCCSDSHAKELRLYAKNRIKALGLLGEGGIRINLSGCLGRCALGPTMVVYPDGVWYSYRNEADIDEIIDRHLLQGEIVERLLMPTTGLTKE